MSNTSYFTKTVSAASATNIATSQAAVAGTPLTLNGAVVAGGVATIDAASATNSAPGRRVLITSTSAVETASVVITGTNSSGNIITETDTFSGASTTLQSNLDFVTVTKIVPSGTIVGNLSAGTNGVGSSPWLTLNYFGHPPMNVGFAVELVSGAVNFTGQYTYDDPNALQAGLTTPLPFNMTAITTQSATIDSTISTPVCAVRILVNSGTGQIRVRVVQVSVA